VPVAIAVATAILTESEYGVYKPKGFPMTQIHHVTAISGKATRIHGELLKLGFEVAAIERRQIHGRAA
jgi:hypothetical protein